MGNGLKGNDHLSAILAIPGRDPVAPPDLPGDAPVADIIHPFKIGAFPDRRDDPGRTFLDGRDRRAGKRFGPHEPLFGDRRLDNGLAAITVADVVQEGLHLFQQAGLFEVFEYFLAALEPLLAGVPSRVTIHFPGVVDHPHNLEPVPPADFKVIRVVRGSNLQGPGAKFLADVSVGDYGNPAVHQRKNDFLPDEFHVPLVFRMHGNGGIAEHRLRPRSGHH